MTGVTCGAPGPGGFRCSPCALRRAGVVAFVPVVMLVGALLAPPSGEEEAFRRVLSAQSARYPEMGAQDVYKLTLQATMGGRHAGLDSASAQRRLEDEIARLGHGPAEPVLDAISSDGRILRVNLRPYLAAGGDAATLLRAFVRTAHEHRGSPAALRRHLAYAERMAAAGLLPVPRSALRETFERMRREGFPAVGHSERYARAYRPAYRVVAREFLP